MLMGIWTFVIVTMLIGLVGFALFVYGFYAGMDYVNLEEDDIKYNRGAERLAKVGSWIINNVNM